MSMVTQPDRPSRAGFFVGAAIIVVGVVLGAAAMATGVFSAIGQLPSFTSDFAPGTTQRVELDQAGTWALYSGGSSARGACVIESADGETTPIDLPSSSMEFSRDSRQWYWVGTFTISEAGSYEFECSGTAGADRFAVGEKPNVSGFAGRLVGGIAALLALPCLGFVIGVVIIIVTAVRRSGSGGPSVSQA